MSCSEPWARTGNQDRVLGDTAWENFLGTAETTEVCASKRLPSQTTSTQSNTANEFLQDSREGSYLRNAYKVRIIPAKQNPSKNLSVLNIVTFTDSATVSPKIRMKMMENSSTGRRPTLHMERGKNEEASLDRAAMLDADPQYPASDQQMWNES